MSESRSRLLSVVRTLPPPAEEAVPADSMLLEPGLADVVTLQRRRAAEVRRRRGELLRGHAG